jgi:predicted branched-subunit amino acid permease
MPTTSTHDDARADVLAGARAMSPWLLGIVPYGLVIGVSAARADIPTFAGWLTGPLIYTGSAQVAVIELLDARAAPLVVVAAVLALNLRFVLYSASMAPHWRDTPRWWRALAAYLLVDPSFAVGVAGYERSADPRRGHRHYLGGAALLWVAWLTAIAGGAVAGARLPTELHLELVVPLFLVGEVASRLTGRAVIHAVGATVAVALLAMSAPLHLGPMLAMAAGLAVGLHVDGGDR